MPSSHGGKRCLPFPFAVLGALLLIVSGRLADAQQVPDTVFTWVNHHPAHPTGTGPLVLIDEAHNNFHTARGGFYPFAKLSREDGYRVDDLPTRVTNEEVLMSCRILVIANALDSSNLEAWRLPTPSAFTPAEIVQIRKWVWNGGRLFLIADHMPFAGAACELGKAFGFEFLNGFAFTGQQTWPPSLFTTACGNLLESPVIDGKNGSGPVDTVATFTGSAFLIPDGAIPLLRFKETSYSLQPETAWQFREDTPRQNLAGYFQGALLSYGKGKVAVFGEAAMFTAQIVNGTIKVGFNSEVAPQNAQFTLNVLHWLNGE